MSHVCRDDTYLGVKLCAIVALAAVQGNDLVTDDVVAGLQVLGDGGSRREIGTDELVSGPGSGAAWSNQASLRNLAPTKSTWGKRRTIA